MTIGDEFSPNYRLFSQTNPIQSQVSPYMVCQALPAQRVRCHETKRGSVDIQAAMWRETPGRLRNPRTQFRSSLCFVNGKTNEINGYIYIYTYTCKMYNLNGNCWVFQINVFFCSQAMFDYQRLRQVFLLLHFSKDIWFWPLKNLGMFIHMERY